MIDIIDTRDLIEERDASLEELRAFLYDLYKIEIEKFEDLEKLNDFQKGKYKEDKDILQLINIITEINNLEEEVGIYFQYGVTLISKNYFLDYVKDFVTDCGYIPRNLPHWIEINWESTAENLKVDYIETVFRDLEFYFAG